MTKNNQLQTTYSLKDLIDELVQIGLDNPESLDAPILVNGEHGLQGEITEINYFNGLDGVKSISIQTDITY